MKSSCAKLKMEKDWVHLHDRLVTAASEIKATTTSRPGTGKSSAYLKRSDGWPVMQPTAGTP